MRAKLWSLARTMTTTFATATLIYVVNHATELHINAWLAAIISGAAAAIAAITHSGDRD